MPLFQVEIELDASEAIEAAATLTRAAGQLGALPDHLRQAVERFSSPQASAAEDEARIGLTGGVDRGVAVVGCSPALRALVGSLRAQGVG